MIKKFCYVLFFLSSLTAYAIGEKVPFSLLVRLLPHDPVVLEAGAHIGEDTKWMSEMWKKGTIHSFEPLPNCFEKIQKIAKDRKNVFCYQLALSNKEGTLPFYVADGASSLLRPTDHINQVYFHADLEHPLMVNCTTIDNWAKKNDVKKIDFCWLDMEGNELCALKGAKNILKTVKVIYTEVNLQEFWEGCVKYDELKAYLKKQGFEEVWSDFVPGWQGNVLFVNENL